MSRMYRLAIPILAASTVAWNVVAQDIPGEIPDPSSYKGSMELQRQEQESAAQVQQQNGQMQQQLDQHYAAYAPPAGGAGGGGAAVRLKDKPLLPPAKNPLLGRWRQIAGKPVELGFLGALPGGSEVVNGAFGGACKSVFGTGMVSFTPTALNWVAPDGHEEILNHVEYRSDGANVIVIPTDPDPVPFIFGFPNRDRAVAAFFGCAMARITATAKPAVATAQAAPAAAPATSAILNLSIGMMVSGKFSPAPAGIQVWVTSQNPDANLMKAGFNSTPVAPPVENLFAACKIGQGGNQERCTQGFAAMRAGALGAVTSDAAGHAQTGALKPGHYYLVGFTPYQGHSLVWHMPVDLHAGSNAVTLTPQNGSVSH
ncbi:MAG: hypothetical protein ACRET4_14025 [Steroidobacteraceae bacterium]